MKKISAFVMALAISFMGAFAPVSVFAGTDHLTNRCSATGLDDTEKAAMGCNDTRKAPDVIQSLINVALSIVGILCVIMIIFAGQRYITANGDPSQITKSKTMIIYSVAGLVVSLLAFAIVNFVLFSL